MNVLPILPKAEPIVELVISTEEGARRFLELLEKKGVQFSVPISEMSHENMIHAARWTYCAIRRNENEIRGRG